ncbi:hypothetical protein ABPG77_001844, partial [Micractinium sp. CCAP 211/92]
AEINKNQRMEGSFINKSLLTLGTVIHKLSEGRPRTSPSATPSSPGFCRARSRATARASPSSAPSRPPPRRAEETHNTLKFASRAKRIEVSVARNEIMDQSSLIARYQQEIQLLKGQLEMVMRERGGLPLHDPLHPEVRTLRERLEEEHMALLARERDKMALEERIARLARCILQGAAAATQMERRLRAPAGEQAAAAGLLASDRRGAGAAADGPGAPLAAAPPPPLADVAATVGGVRSAGALFPGQQLEQASTASRGAGLLSECHEVEADLLRRQVATLAAELVERDRMLHTIHSMKGRGAPARDGGGGEDDLALQVMLADRDFMQTQLQRQTSTAAKSIDYRLDANQEDEGEDVAELEAAAKPLRHGYDHVLRMEEKVLLVLDSIRRKDEQLSDQRHVLDTLTGLEEQVQVQLRELDGENKNLRQELERLDAQNNNLQGYNLDYMSNEDLGELIGSLTQAVERVRITVQLRRLAGRKAGPTGTPSFNLSHDSESRGGMTREAMRQALEELQSNGHSRRSTLLLEEDDDGSSSDEETSDHFGSSRVS